MPPLYTSEKMKIKSCFLITCVAIVIWSIAIIVALPDFGTSPSTQISTKQFVPTSNKNSSIIRIMYIGDSIARQISSCSLGMYNGTQMHNWCDLGFMYKDAADKKAANNGPWSLSEGEIEVRFRWDPYLGNLCGGNFEGIDQWATHVVVSSGLHQARDGNDKEKWGHCMETLGEWISKKGMKESFIYVTSPRVVEHKLPNVRYADYSNKKVTPFSEAATGK